jgi:hypothetical protein
LASTGLQYNHWVTLLQVTEALYVQINMTRVDVSEDGVLFLSEDCFPLHTAYQRWLAIVGYRTVGEILDLIFDVKTDIKLSCYKLSPTGQGCAYWTYRLMERIEDAGYIETGASAAVLEEIQWHWANNQADSWLGLRNRKGEFL